MNSPAFGRKVDVDEVDAGGMTISQRRISGLSDLNALFAEVELTLAAHYQRH